MRVLSLPAMVNAHSHAFQIALRGVGERPVVAGAGDFWSWRTAMFSLADTLTPKAMYAVALRAYREMLDAGYGAVGEFHYVHHHPGGTPYDDPNAMAIALANAARDAGLAIVLLPAAYHRAGWEGGDVPPSSGQTRFCDPDVETFLERVEALRRWADGEDGVHVGVAAHSVRAVPSQWLEAIAAYADEHELVRHIHASEQRRELAECRAEHGCTPIELLDRTGFLGRRTSVVHAIHVSNRDVELLAASSSIVVSCPTTEGNLGDGHFPAMRYADAGVRIAIGSDSQVRIDPFEEARELETGARRERQTRRGLHLRDGDVWMDLQREGAASLGISPAGSGWAQVNLEHPTLCGIEEQDLPAALVMCASVAAVVIDPDAAAR